MSPVHTQPLETNNIKRTASAKNIRIGDIDINNVYFGDKRINKAYLGESVIFETIDDTPVGDTTFKSMLQKATVWNVLGDSLTEGYLLEDMQSIYFNVLKKKYSNISKVNNYGVGGTCITSGDISEQNSQYGGFCDRYSSMSDDADLITVWGGTNDFLDTATFGTSSDSSSDTYYGALNVLCKGLKAKYPSKSIVFMTPVNFSSENHGGKTLLDYVNAMKEVCKKHSIPVIDLYNDSGITLSNLSQYTVEDRIHLNALGHGKVISCMESSTFDNGEQPPGPPVIDGCAYNVDFTSESGSVEVVNDSIGEIPFTLGTPTTVVDGYATNIVEKPFTSDVKSLNIGTGEFTIEIKIKLTTLPTTEETLSVLALAPQPVSDVWGESMTLVYKNTNKFEVWCGDNGGGWEHIETTKTYPLSTECHIFITRNANNKVTLYINEVDAPSSITFNKKPSFDTLTKEWSKEGYDLNSIKIYKKCLSSSDISNIFK